jgi:hypothetical protein
MKKIAALVFLTLASVGVAAAHAAHQHLVPLPYPQALGPNAFGNPTSSSTTR